MAIMSFIHLPNEYIIKREKREKLWFNPILKTRVKLFNQNIISNRSAK